MLLLASVSYENETMSPFDGIVVSMSSFGTSNSTPSGLYIKRTDINKRQRKKLKGKHTVAV